MIDNLLLWTYNNTITYTVVIMAACLTNLGIISRIVMLLISTAKWIDIVTWLCPGSRVNIETYGGQIWFSYKHVQMCTKDRCFSAREVFSMTLKLCIRLLASVYYWGPFNWSPPWTKLAPFWQTTFSNVFSWMKMTEFLFQFSWSLFLMLQSTMAQHLFRSSMAQNRQQAIIWNNVDQIRWRIYN